MGRLHSSRRESPVFLKIPSGPRMPPQYPALLSGSTFPLPLLYSRDHRLTSGQERFSYLTCRQKHHPAGCLCLLYKGYFQSRHLSYVCRRILFWPARSPMTTLPHRLSILFRQQDASVESFLSGRQFPCTFLSQSSDRSEGSRYIPYFSRLYRYRTDRALLP